MGELEVVLGAAKAPPCTSDGENAVHTYESLIERFWEVGVTDTMGTGREIAALPKLLDPSEVVHYATSGFMDGNSWLMVCTDRRVLLVDKGFFYGVKTEEVPLDMINSVSGSKAILFGKIEVAYGSGTMIVEKVGRDTVDPMKRAINEQITAFKRNQYGHAVVSAPQGPAALVRELKELLDEGLMTQEEFDFKRREILGL